MCYVADEEAHDGKAIFAQLKLVDYIEEKGKLQMAEQAKYDQKLADHDAGDDHGSKCCCCCCKSPEDRERQRQMRPSMAALPDMAFLTNTGESRATHQGLELVPNLDAENNQA